MKLSIVVNMYNTAKYMPKCIDSLLKQDIPASDYEIILVDDCSPDESLAMANECLAWSLGKQPSIFNLQSSMTSSRPTIKVCHHEVNKGLAGGRNTGIDAAEGEYLSFVDPDDYVAPNSYKALLEQMDQEQLDMLRFRYQNVDEQYQPMPDYEMESKFDYSSQIMSGRDFLVHRMGIQCYVWPYIYRLQFLRESGIRFIEGCYLDDTPFLPRVLQAAKRINCVDVRRHYYLQRATSMVRISSSEGIKRKMDGQWILRKIMLEQYQQLTDEGVKHWYDAMMSHSVFGLLQMNAIYNYSQCAEIIAQLRHEGAFPLSTYMASAKEERKMKLVNFSPMLYCMLMHYKTLFNHYCKDRKSRD